MARQNIRVLVVDDSAVVRQALRQHLETDPRIVQVATAPDGRSALRKLERVDPHVITMDVEMPGLDGIATLKAIMRRAPRPVIMLSAFTMQGAQKTIRALELGAVDFIQKPSGRASQHIGDVVDELRAKIASVAHRQTTHQAPVLQAPTPQAPTALASGAPAAMLRNPDGRVLLIGSSTGGVEAIRYLAQSLPADFPLGILAVQHMPAGFTQAYASRLNEQVAIEVKEAAHHDLIRPGRLLIAPGHSHLLARWEGGIGFVELSRRPRVSGHRPSVDVLFNSVAEQRPEAALALLLTGMGRDGADGLLALRNGGAETVAQDEASSVVYGMPKAAVDGGAANRVLGLSRLPGYIRRWADCGDSLTGRTSASERALRLGAQGRMETPQTWRKKCQKST